MKRGALIVLGPLAASGVLYLAFTGHLMLAIGVTLLLMCSVDGSTEYDDPHP
jgi:hypothetical protein